MAEKENFRLKQLHGRLGDLMIQLTKVNFSQAPAPETWTPAVNAFRCEKGYAVCVELAGVKKEAVEIEVHDRTIHLRGRREIPEPRAKGEEAKQILAMEIDSGLFARDITLPTDIEVEGVRAEHTDGFIWIFLPHRSHS